jgi:hypothetical protein
LSPPLHRQVIDLIEQWHWTIPQPSGEWVRQTEPTILGLIEHTQQELLSVSFAVLAIEKLILIAIVN